MTTTGDWNAADYARNSSAQRGWADGLIAQLTLDGTEHVLDIGSGSGAVTAEIARRVPYGRVLGIDSSADMVRVASGSFPPDEHPNLSFRRMDAASIELPAEFDVAFSNAVFHWVADHPAILRGVRSALKPGGRLLAQFGGRGNASGVKAVFARVIDRPQWREFFTDFEYPYHFHGPEQYREWLPAAGFECRRAELFPKDMTHDGPNGLMGWLRTTKFPYSDRVPADRRGPFMAEVLAEYIDEYPVDEQGNTHVHMVRLEVEAVAI